VHDYPRNAITEEPLNIVNGEPQGKHTGPPSPARQFPTRPHAGVQATLAGRAALKNE